MDKFTKTEYKIRDVIGVYVENNKKEYIIDWDGDDVTTKQVEQSACGRKFINKYKTRWNTERPIHCWEILLKGEWVVMKDNIHYPPKESSSDSQELSETEESDKSSSIYKPTESEEQAAACDDRSDTDSEQETLDIEQQEWNTDTSAISEQQWILSQENADLQQKSSHKKELDTKEELVMDLSTNSTHNEKTELAVNLTTDSKQNQSEPDLFPMLSAGTVESEKVDVRFCCDLAEVDKRCTLQNVSVYRTYSVLLQLSVPRIDTMCKLQILADRTTKPTKYFYQERVVHFNIGVKNRTVETVNESTLGIKRYLTRKFKKHFKKRTGNSWSNRYNFHKIYNNWTLVVPALKPMLKSPPINTASINNYKDDLTEKKQNAIKRAHSVLPNTPITTIIDQLKKHNWHTNEMIMAFTFEEHQVDKEKTEQQQVAEETDVIQKEPDNKTLPKKKDIIDHEPTGQEQIDLALAEQMDVGDNEIWEQFGTIDDAAWDTLAAISSAMPYIKRTTLTTPSKAPPNLASNVNNKNTPKQVVKEENIMDIDDDSMIDKAIKIKQSRTKTKRKRSSKKKEHKSRSKKSHKSKSKKTKKTKRKRQHRAIDNDDIGFTQNLEQAIDSANSSLAEMSLEPNKRQRLK